MGEGPPERVRERLRAVGLWLLLLGLAQVGVKLLSGLGYELFWCCQVGALLLALGLLLCWPRATAIGTMWLTFGLPIWLLGLWEGESTSAVSIAMHLGGLAGGVWAARRLGVPRGCWWQGALGLYALKCVTRQCSPEAANVNLSWGIYHGYEATFLHSYALYVVVLFAFIVSLFALEERLLRGRGKTGECEDACVGSAGTGHGNGHEHGHGHEGDREQERRGV